MIRAAQFQTDTQSVAGQAYAGKLSIVSTDHVQDNSATVFLDASDAGYTSYYAGNNTHSNLLGAYLRVTGGSAPQ